MSARSDHHLRCEAPICPYDPGFSDNLETWSWYPDERICLKAPFTHIQKIQKKIKKLYERGLIARDRYYCSSDLLRIRRVTKGIKGRSSRRILQGFTDGHKKKGGRDSNEV